MDSIKILPFKFKHYSLSQDLLVNKTPYKTLPKIGYIAIRCKTPIAIGFLRLIEGGLTAELDLVYVEHSYGQKLANTALKLVIESLLQDAKDLKLKEITVSDQFNETLKQLGLTIMDYRIGVSYTYALGF